MAQKNVSLHTRRSADGDPIADAEILQRTINGLRGTGVAPRGVYRFRSHEEAERWQIHQMALLHARHGSKTSSSSAGG